MPIFASRLFKFLRLFLLSPVLAINQIRAWIPSRKKKGVSIGKVNHIISFEFDFSLDPAINSMYCGGYEVWTLNALRNILRPGDTFIDVGANIGYLTAYGASLVGRQGQIHSFEPVPEYFSRLSRLISLNPGYNFYLNDYALGERNEESVMAITSLPNIGWNTMVAGFMEEETTREKITIRVKRLDEYLSQAGVRQAALIKIDAEGFEFPILKGLTRFLERTPLEFRPFLLIEVAPQAYPLLHATLDDLAALLRKYGYRIQSVDDPGREISVQQITKTSNILCLPK
jgi:FkbM family methyltransferase